MSTLYKCRLCLKLARNKIPIFKNDFPKMIELLTGIKVDPNDDFPKTSCVDCANNLKIALRTKKQIIQSHKTLVEEFLAKCKEYDYNNVTNLNTETKKSNKDNLVEKDNMQTDLNRCNVEQSRITDLGDQSEDVDNDVVSRLRVRSLRTMTERNLKSDLSASTAVTTKKNCQNIKQLLIFEESNTDTSVNAIEEEEKSAKNDNWDDLNGEPASPLSDCASDVDWAPDKTEEKKTTPQIIKSQKKKRKTSLKPILKASDGVFFVKKQNTSITRKKKTAETVIRIKKKPKDRTPPARVTCEICKKEVQSYWLQKHMETHEYNPATCEFCGLISKSATALRHHVFYYHRSSADEYICDQCGRNFRSKYRLNLHKKKEHGGTKDFECTTCGKKFFERMHLKRHVDKTHKNIRPYICDFCGKTFKSRNHIKIHERIHSKEAPYNCHMCGESFKMKLTLRTHLRGVHNVQELQTVFCDICKRGFASDLALKAHINSRIHETEKCQYCSEMFTREYMVNHLRDSHGVGTAAITDVRSTDETSFK